MSVEKTSRKSAKENTAALRSRRRAAGFREILLWVHEEDRVALVEAQKRLLAERFKIMGVE